MRTMATFLTTLCLFWQSAVYAGVATQILNGLEQSHALMHFLGISHHHHQDESDERGVPHFNMKSLTKSVLADYPSHDEITAKLKAAVAKRPEIMQLFSIGKSVRGKELWVVKISDNVKVDEVGTLS